MSQPSLLRADGATSGFEIYGNQNQRGMNPFKRETLIEQLMARIIAAKLNDVVNFKSWTSNPGRALYGADVLIRLRRQMNPWGRDIIEAMTFGLPVVNSALFTGFVEPGRNGYVASEYKPNKYR